MNWHAIEDLGADWVRAEKAQITSGLALVAAEDRLGNVFVYLEEETGKRTEIYDGFLDLDEAQECMGRQLCILAAAEWMLTVCEYGDLAPVWPDGMGLWHGLDAITDMIESFSDDLPPAAAVRRRIAEIRTREAKEREARESGVGS